MGGGEGEERAGEKGKGEAKRDRRGMMIGKGEREEEDKGDKRGDEDVKG